MMVFARIIGLVDFSNMVNNNCRCWSQNSELTIINLARARVAAVCNSVSGYFWWSLHTTSNSGPKAASNVLPTIVIECITNNTFPHKKLYMKDVLINLDDTCINDLYFNFYVDFNIFWSSEIGPPNRLSWITNQWSQNLQGSQNLHKWPIPVRFW